MAFVQGREFKGWWVGGIALGSFLLGIELGHWLFLLLWGAK